VHRSRAHADDARCGSRRLPGRRAHLSVLETVWEDEGRGTHIPKTEQWIPDPLRKQPRAAPLEECVTSTNVHLTAGLGGEPGRESLSASAVEFHPGVTIAPSASERQFGEESDEARFSLPLSDLTPCKESMGASPVREQTLRALSRRTQWGG
jgi:hypothetical protein